LPSDFKEIFMPKYNELKLSTENLGSIFLLFNDFEHHISGYDFDTIFGDMGDHQWQKFTKYHNSLVALFVLSDSDCREALVKAVIKFQEEQ
jgi:hypothetical protein